MVQSLQLIFIIVNCNIKLPVGLISFCFRRACVLTLPLRSPNRCLCCRKKQCKVYWLLAFPWKGASSAHVLPINFSELWWNYAEACWKSKGSFAEFCRNFEQKIISILCVLTQKKLKSCVLREKLFCSSLNLAIISTFSVLKTRTRVDSSGNRIFLCKILKMKSHMCSLNEYVAWDFCSSLNVAPSRALTSCFFCYGICL